MSDNNIWKIKDKEWMKARRERWKGIQAQLKNIDLYLEYYKKQFRFHKAYFLKGELLPYDQKWLDTSKYNDPNKLGKPFELNPAFKIWYYPEIDERLFLTWGKNASSDEIREIFGFHKKIGMQIETDYEFFSDRSIYIDRYMIPNSMQGIEALTKRPYYSPELILKYIMKGMRNCVIASGGNFLLSFAFELFIDCLNHADFNACVAGNRPLKEDLLGLMYQTLYIQQKDVYLNTGLPQKLKKELPDLFDAGVNPEVDELWAKVKSKAIIPEWAK